MKAHVGISIDKPCHQNWDKMEPTARGRFCKACAKTVLDVTNWKKEDILSAHQNSSDGLCIRLPETQLQSLKKQPVKWTMHKTLLLSLLLFFSKLPIVKAFVNTDIFDDHNPASQDKSTNIHISGIAYDTSEMTIPVSYATIIILKGDKILSTAFTDAEGRYTFNLTKDSTMGDSITIECSHLSYATFTKPVKIASKLEVDFFLKESTISLKTVVIARNRIITMGAIRMGAISISSAKLVKPWDQYDTKTYSHDDLQRYNLNR